MKRCECRSYHRRTGEHVTDCPKYKAKRCKETPKQCKRCIMHRESKKHRMCEIDREKLLYYGIVGGNYPRLLIESVLDGAICKYYSPRLYIRLWEWAKKVRRR